MAACRWSRRCFWACWSPARCERRARRWAPLLARGSNEFVASAHRVVRGAAEQEAAAQEEQLRIAISRAHAESLSAYAKQERRL